MVVLRALFRGRCHVLEAIDGSGRASELIGRPVGEMFPDSRDVLAALDAAYRMGCTVVVTAHDPKGRPGIAIIAPVDLRGQRWGVAAEWTPLAPPQTHPIAEPSTSVA